LPFGKNQAIVEVIEQQRKETENMFEVEQKVKVKPRDVSNLSEHEGKTGFVFGYGPEDIVAVMLYKTGEVIVAHYSCFEKEEGFTCVHETLNYDPKTELFRNADNSLVFDKHMNQFGNPHVELKHGRKEKTFMLTSKARGGGHCEFHVDEIDGLIEKLKRIKG